ncbi:MAG: hypothetical protein ACK2UW_13340 [Anaerolineales bacterium]
MTDFQDYLGWYHMLGMTIEVKALGARLVAALRGVPPGYEIPLFPAGGSSFTMQGGPFAGATIYFEHDPAGAVSAMRAGPWTLGRVNPEALDDLPQVQRLLAPPFELTPEKQARFAALWQQARVHASGDWIDYDLPEPLHEFVQYLTAQDEVIFHGSNNQEIETFQPVRKSVELNDESGRGNIQGVYGTHDGLWAMFFAVVDRPRLKGSIRNGVLYFQNQAGETRPVYNFSINQEQLAERPYTRGALYLLPRMTFRRLELLPGVPANEWASEAPVRPIAKLRLEPADFPFLEQIDGHDDGALIRLNEISHAIRQAAVAAELEGDRFAVSLPAEAEVAAQLEEYANGQRLVMPAARFEIQLEGGEVTLVVTSLPPAMQQVLAEAYAELLG